jgi:hypothetical protein
MLYHTFRADLLICDAVDADEAPHCTHFLTSVATVVGESFYYPSWFLLHQMDRIRRTGVIYGRQ